MENGGGEERGRHSEPKKSILALNRPGRTARICLPPPPLFSKDLLPPNSKLFLCALSQGASGNRRRCCSKMGRCLRATHGNGESQSFRDIYIQQKLFSASEAMRRRRNPWLSFFLLSILFSPKQGGNPRSFLFFSSSTSLTVNAAFVCVFEERGRRRKHNSPLE